MERKELKLLADKYESESFVLNDPIRFVKRYNNIKDIEVSAVIASWLSYGEKKEFMPRMSYVFDIIMGTNPYEYILGLEWERYKDDYRSLYRMTSWHNFAMLCRKLHEVYSRFDNLEKAVIDTKYKKKYKYHYQAVCSLLCGETMIPNPNSNCANKRVNMMMRWLVRQKSTVDIGIWENISPAELLVPADKFSLNQAKNIGIVGRVEESKKSCIVLTNYSKKIFPEDPARLDFSLYGHGEKSK